MRIDGYYINLDRSIDRRQLFDLQLDQLGLTSWIQRFTAVDGKAVGPSEEQLKNNVWACRKSHELIIRHADPDSATIIFEDDVEIFRDFSSTITKENLQGLVEQAPTTDIVFLDCAMYWLKAPLLLASAERHLKRRIDSLDGDDDDRHFSGVDIIDAKGTYAYCSAAYVVTPHGKSTLLRLIDSVREEEFVAIDTLYRRWIETGDLTCSLFVPFLATPRFNIQSTITTNEDVSQTVDLDEHLRINVLRRLLFAGKVALDLQALESSKIERPSSLAYRLGMQVYETFREKF
ncbi:hypothetical protein CI15_20350 [Paraburkholderia monticola]|uniref:Glycosyl transferase family 25 domain-containing protein n=1 Tax=Paraburkholderia monticola TaxID=1399968 RepID=A0A149PKD2_9BURK|nr:glycosyltransferase family 25 protein [Paraburkholderia monticola]KXU85515.1 hypothetical protein CI15_20350 [Paraburkholderia monticola]